MNKSLTNYLLSCVKSHLLTSAIVLLAFHSSFSQSAPVNLSGGEGKGIKWTIADNWEAVKAKALKENKYIFVDCYTTWCGPCKAMDKFVYENDSVGGVFNDKFISIKVQMDITKNDDEQTKKWYGDAVKLFKLFRISAYPGFVFLSPRGEIVYQEMGYKVVQQMIDLSQIATRSGKAYKDIYAEYDRLVAEYKAGVKHYERMPYMIQTAVKFHDDDFARELVKEHSNYIMTLPPRERYTKDNIQLWASLSLKSDDKRFSLFYKNGELVDSVMEQSGYAERVVDYTVYVEIIQPFLQKINDTIMEKNLPVRTDGTIEPDYTEADWKSLEKMIRKKFNKSCAERNVLAVKVRWYQQRRNYPSYVKWRLVQMKTNPPSIDKELGTLNGFGWETFLYVTDKSLIKQVQEWTGKVLEKFPRYPEMLDTHAGLLYKLGKVSEAIVFEEKAIALSFEVKDTAAATGFEKVVKQMRNGERTYLDKGAIWE